MKNGSAGVPPAHTGAKATDDSGLENLFPGVPGWRGAELNTEGEMHGGDPAGKRILVVEDEFFVALVVEETLQSLGCTVLGPFADLAEATEAATRETVDAAVLDINLRGEMVYPLAEHLNRQGVPFVFTTGYAIADLPERFRVFGCLRKPVDARTLKQAVHHMLN
jgi:CheY-like chemotaxis protein